MNRLANPQVPSLVFVHHVVYVFVRQLTHVFEDYVVLVFVRFVAYVIDF
jgi:hypothetical protein